MATHELVDPYIDPESGVLQNLRGAQSWEELAGAEAFFVATRQIQLASNPIGGDPSLKQLQEIHQHLFQDVYSWAGKLRTVDIRKSSDDAEPFMPVSRLDMAAGYVFGELGQENFLRGLDRDAFVDRLSDFYDQVNYLHPFREGNGRAQRVMWSQVASKAGWSIDWNQVSGAENNLASSLAGKARDLSGLHQMFDRVVSPRVGTSSLGGGDGGLGRRLRLSRGTQVAKVSPVESDLVQRVKLKEQERER